MHIFVPLKIPTAMVKRSVKDLKSSFGALKKYVLLTEGWQGGGMGGWYLTKFLEGSLYPEVQSHTIQ